MIFVNYISETDATIIDDALNEDYVVDIAVQVACEDTVRYLNECTVHVQLDKSACTYAAVSCGKKSGETLTCVHYQPSFYEK